MSVWIGIALLVVAIVGALVAWQRRQRHEAEPRPVEAPREADATAQAPATVAPPVVAPTLAPPVAPPVVAAAPIEAARIESAPIEAAPVEAAAIARTPVVAPPAPIAPAVAPAPPPAAIMPPDPVTIAQPRTTAKPPPPLELVTRVLVLERATQAQWESATAIESVDTASPFADSLTGSLQRQMPSSADGGMLYRARFERGDALALAQANLIDLKERVERRDGVRGAQTDPARDLARDPARDPAFVSWLDGAASAALAGQALAAWARARHIGALDAESGEIKAAIQAQQARFDAEAVRLLKGASQDLSRFLREAREGYAAALRKPVFLERVQAACTEAGNVWSRLEGRLDAIRTMLAAQADAPRLGEVQLERSLAALRAMADERRVQVLGARLLAAIHGVRTALGAPRPKAGESELVQALGRWRSSVAAERALLDRLIERVRTAKAPEYAGKGEFESNRVAARAAYDRLVADGATAAGAALEAACAAEARGFLDGEADQFTLYMRVAPDGRIVEWRRAPLERDARTADDSRQAAAAR
jgi:hypothetical protein